MNQKTDNYDPSIREELDKEDWENVLPHVLKYSVSRSKKYHWLGYIVEPEELVQEAVARAYGVGKNETYRNWNKNKYPKLGNFLISIIESMTSHSSNHSIRFRSEPLNHKDGSPRDFKINSETKKIVSTTNLSSPENNIVQSENLQVLTDELKTFAEVDEEMGMVILCLEDGVSHPRDIAKETGYDIKRVYNILRRLRTRLNKYNPNPKR